MRGLDCFANGRKITHSRVLLIEHVLGWEKMVATYAQFLELGERKKRRIRALAAVLPPLCQLRVDREPVKFDLPCQHVRSFRPVHAAPDTTLNHGGGAHAKRVRVCVCVTM